MIIAQTERLIIRPWTVTDGEYYRIMSTDVGYNCFAPPGYYLVNSDIELAEKIRLRISAYESRGLGKFPIFLKGSNQFIGTCGIDPYVINEAEEMELGYRLCLAHWGKGYATEASRILLDYGFNILGMKKIVAFAARQNKSSIKVIEKLGFERTGNLIHAGVLHELYEASRENL